jgi:hypothetical protein
MMIPTGFLGEMGGSATTTNQHKGIYALFFHVFA